MNTYQMKIEEWEQLKQKAKNGDAESQWKVGSYCTDEVHDENGKIIISQNFTEAVYWFKQAAEQGLSSAQYSLGICLSDGDRTDLNLKKSIYWMKKALKNGETVAAHGLACVYRDQGNYTKAFSWYARAVQMEFYPALLDLGKCYYFGVGVRKNAHEAILCFKKLLSHEETECEEDVEDALYYLGLAHLQGMGCKRSTSKAKRYFEKANKGC
jgi:uncharacterized protein